MAGLRERVLEFLRDDYRAHRTDPLRSQLGDYKYEEHGQAFRVRLKQLMVADDALEAQRWLVFHGYLKPQPPLAAQELRRQAERALASTPDGTAARRRGNLCERIMECALDAAAGAAALGSSQERQTRRALAEADYIKQRTPAWPPFCLEGEQYERLIACLVGAEAEAWLYDAGYPAAEQDRRVRQAEEEASRPSANVAATPAASAASAVVTASPKPRLKEVPLALVERYYAAAAGGPKGAPAAVGSTPAAPVDALHSQIVQLWDALMDDPAAYADVLVPLALDDRTGAGLYLMGPDLLEGEHPLNVWCSPSTWDKVRRLGRPPFLLGIVRRSDQPDLGLLPFPLVRERLGASDTQLNNMSVEVLPPESSPARTVANALIAFRDECATDPQFNTSLAFYRATNVFAPANCPERFRALFAEDDF